MFLVGFRRYGVGVGNVEKCGVRCDNREVVKMEYESDSSIVGTDDGAMERECTAANKLKKKKKKM